MKCDKCGREVAPCENAVTLYRLVKGQHTSTVTEARHLFPVYEGDNLICEGSPSTAQYLPGQPQDTRRRHFYQQHNETAYRAAYETLKKLT